MTQLNGPDDPLFPEWSGLAEENTVQASFLLHEEKTCPLLDLGPRSYLVLGLDCQIVTLETANSPFFKLSQGSETNYCCSKLIKLKNEPADVQKYIRRAKLKMARRIYSI